MPYLIETFDKPGHAQVRARERDVHLAFLERHKSLLLACGAKLNDDGGDAGGGVYIVDVDSREAAERFISLDPFSEVGLFERVTIVRWRKAYVDGQCRLGG
ncbi:YciI family protein [Pseudomonas sp. S31]|uniref:YciI family protein n=1 Tax=Pseudomonas sp. S31 TaxID=1564473 RepID=UPI001912DAF2|nr:YciI family protein [Pseudomonas sp. S31]MBK4999676.1 YciI family protein [Pseudomonas sp. S31]